MPHTVAESEWPQGRSGSWVPSRMPPGCTHFPCHLPMLGTMFCPPGINKYSWLNESTVVDLNDFFFLNRVFHHHTCQTGQQCETFLLTSLPCLSHKSFSYRRPRSSTLKAQEDAQGSACFPPTLRQLWKHPSAVAGPACCFQHRLSETSGSAHYVSGSLQTPQTRHIATLRPAKYS